MRAKEFAKHIFEQVKRDWHIPVTEHQVYSTAETVVGVWTDGKPLYRKTVSCGALPNATTKNVAHGVTNLDKIIKTEGIAFATSGSNGYYFPLPGRIISDIEIIATIRISGANIEIGTKTNLSAYADTFVTLYYTKTTDTAASPKVPFEPLHEWSTNEKLVGYWIDGKPVYEKTITGTSPADRGEINTGISNVSNAVITQMRITNAAGYNANFAFTTVSADVKADGSKIWFEYSSDNFKSRPFTATIHYTKTTD